MPAFAPPVDELVATDNLDDAAAGFTPPADELVSSFTPPPVPVTGPFGLSPAPPAMQSFFDQIYPGANLDNTNAPAPPPAPVQLLPDTDEAAQAFDPDSAFRPSMLGTNASQAAQMDDWLQRDKQLQNWKDTWLDQVGDRYDTRAKIIRQYNTQRDALNQEATAKGLPFYIFKPDSEVIADEVAQAPTISDLSDVLPSLAAAFIPAEVKKKLGPLGEAQIIKAMVPQSQAFANVVAPIGQGVAEVTGSLANSDDLPMQMMPGALPEKMSIAAWRLMAAYLAVNGGVRTVKAVAEGKPDEAVANGISTLLGGWGWKVPIEETAHEDALPTTENSAENASPNPPPPPPPVPSSDSAAVPAAMDVAKDVPPTSKPAVFTPADLAQLQADLQDNQLRPAISSESLNPSLPPAAEVPVPLPTDFTANPSYEIENSPIPVIETQIADVPATGNDEKIQDHSPDVLSENDAGESDVIAQSAISGPAELTASDVATQHALEIVQNAVGLTKVQAAHLADLQQRNRLAGLTGNVATAKAGGKTDQGAKEVSHTGPALAEAPGLENTNPAGILTNEPPAAGARALADNGQEQTIPDLEQLKSAKKAEQPAARLKPLKTRNISGQIGGPGLKIGTNPDAGQLREVNVNGLNTVERRATFGRAVSTDYRATFFAANPKLEGQVVVHHAVEQQILTRFPGVVTGAEIHSLENLRGIPNVINSKVHLSQMRVEWNKFYRSFEASGTVPGRKQLLQKATEIDAKYGSKFIPPIGGVP